MFPKKINDFRNLHFFSVVNIHFFPLLSIYLRVPIELAGYLHSKQEILRAQAHIKHKCVKLYISGCIDVK